MILKKIAAATKIRVEKVKIDHPIEELKSSVHAPSNPFGFEKALCGGNLSFICEVKKASPSKGLIAEDFPYVAIAQEYEAAGASAVSVLTEPDFFLGSNQILSEIKQAVSIPVLRKDFIIDDYQIVESAAMGADAILLICALLDTATIRRFIEMADSLGLSCLVEAHKAAEVTSALQAGARILGINNRNLQTFHVDIRNSIRLGHLIPRDVCFVSESGINSHEDVAALMGAGASAVLIGETLMRAPNKKAELCRLRGESNDQN